MSAEGTGPLSPARRILRGSVPSEELDAAEDEEPPSEVLKPLAPPSLLSLLPPAGTGLDTGNRRMWLLPALSVVPVSPLSLLLTRASLERPLLVRTRPPLALATLGVGVSSLLKGVLRLVVPSPLLP